MKKFIVEIREVHIQAVEIKARNSKEAIKKVAEAQGTLLDFEYSHTLDPDTWTIRKSDLKEYLKEHRRK